MYGTIQESATAVSYRKITLEHDVYARLITAPNMPGVQQSNLAFLIHA